MPIEVHDYNEHWARTYDDLRAGIWPHVNDVALSIEHVGSTAVPGLAAKPIIDIDSAAGMPADEVAEIFRLNTGG